MNFDSFFGGGRYERFQHLTVLRGASATIGFHCNNIAAGGGRQALQSRRYTLLAGTREVAAVDVPAGATGADFELDLTTLDEGWYVFDIGGLGPEESCPMWPMYVLKGSRAVEHELMPVVSGSHELALKGGMHKLAWVPARFQPTVLPLGAMTHSAFGERIGGRELKMTHLVPVSREDRHYPSVNREGIFSTACTQNYFWGDFTAALPRVRLLDGPRGTGTVTMATHLQVGRRGGVYFCDPWRVGFVSPEGVVRTIAGYRHKSPPSYWGDPPDLELVGDWSAVPESRRGFHELWGLAWDPASLAVNSGAAPINSEQPHLVGPRAFVADSQNNRVCLLTFNPNNHLPPRVTEFITDISDPWDVVCADGVLYVSERKSHRIVAYDVNSGAQIRVVCEGADLAEINHSRFVLLRPGVTREQVRLQPCVAPEGLFLQDGWLYFGSRAMAQVRRINLATGAVETACSFPVDGNTQFAKIALSDGSFGPRGTVFISHWSVSFYTFPHAFINGEQWWYVSPDLEGTGPGYPTACAVGDGRLVLSGAEEGLPFLSRRTADDPVIDRARMLAGQREYLRRGYHLTHGQNGFGYFGVTLPWGVTPEIDYFLEVQGHRQA